MHKKLLLILFVALSSCIGYKDIEFLEVHSTSFANEGDCKPMCAKIKIYNPNSYNIHMRNISVRADLNENTIGNVFTQKKIKLIKNDTIDVDLNFQSDSKQIVSSLFGSLGALFGKPTELLFEGSVKARVFVFRKKIKFSYKSDIKDLIK